MLAVHSNTKSFLRLTAALAVLAGFAQSANAETSRLISNRQPDGLIVSTGNVYFTSHDKCGAQVWRTGQTSNPGQEIQIYAETHSRFGDIVYAKVDGYFFASAGPWSGSPCVGGLKPDARTTAHNAVGAGGLYSTLSIRRIPLAGGNAVTLKVIHNVDIVNSHRNLVTDGSFPYWQDDVSIHKMPIAGGADTVLDQTSPNTPTAGLSLRGSGVTPLHSENVIYADGAKIRFVSILGAITPPTFRVLATGYGRVTTLQATADGVYWGEQSGAVRSKFGASVTTVYSADNMVPTSISVADGGAVRTTQCGSQSCELQMGFAPEPIGASAIGVTATPSYVFWGDAAGVHELTPDEIIRPSPRGGQPKRP